LSIAAVAGIGPTLCNMAALAYIEAMNAKSQIISEFDTPEQAAAYEKWLNEKVAASLADPRPSVPHDEVIGRARKIVKAAGRRKAC